jgi:hypothetical protein
VQPTDPKSGRFSAFAAETARRNEREAGSWQQGFLDAACEDPFMKVQVLRLLTAIGAVAAAALAGGASLKGF